MFLPQSELQQRVLSTTLMQGFDLSQPVPAFLVVELVTELSVKTAEHSDKLEQLTE